MIKKIRKILNNKEKYILKEDQVKNKLIRHYHYLKFLNFSLKLKQLLIKQCLRKILTPKL